MADVRWQPPASSLIQAEACQAVVRAQALEHPVGAGPEEACERGCTAPDRGADVPATPHLPPLSRSLLPPSLGETGVKVGLPPLRPRPFLPTARPPARRQQYRKRPETFCVWRARRPSCSGDVSSRYARRVGTQRLSLLSSQVSVCPPPNCTCSFHCIQLSSIIGVIPSVNVILFASEDALCGGPCGRCGKAPTSCGVWRP